MAIQIVRAYGGESQRKEHPVRFRNDSSRSLPRKDFAPAFRPPSIFVAIGPMAVVAARPENSRSFLVGTAPCGRPPRDPEPRTASPSDDVHVWVHSKKHRTLLLRVLGLAETTTPIALKTGEDGWAQAQYVIPHEALGHTLMLQLCFLKHPRQGESCQSVSLQVREAPEFGITITEAEAQVETSQGWVSASMIRAGQTVRFLVRDEGLEPAGIWFPRCVAGSVIVSRASTVVWQAPLTCSHGDLVFDSFLYAETSFRTADVGTLHVHFAVSERVPSGLVKDSLDFSVTLVP